MLRLDTSTLTTSKYNVFLLDCLSAIAVIEAFHANDNFILSKIMNLIDGFNLNGWKLCLHGFHAIVGYQEVKEQIELHELPRMQLDKASFLQLE